jgi:SOS-response transcriptional repressor LexA
LEIIRIIEQAEILIEGMGLDKSSLAKKLGFPSRYIADIKAGKSKNPGSDFILALINRLNFNPLWLETGEGEMLLGPSSLSAPSGQDLVKTGEGYKVPLLRQKVSCGPGIDWETDDNVEEYIDIFSILPRLATGRMYAFKASGSSMLGAGIRSGDYLIFDAELDFIPKDDIYVFTLDGDVYCKRLEFDMLANKIKIYSVRVADLEKAELVRTLDMTEASYGDRFRIFGRVRYLLRPNRGDD